MPAVASSRRPPPREAAVGLREERQRSGSGATALLASSPLLRRKRRLDAAVSNSSASCPDAAAGDASVRRPLKKQIGLAYAATCPYTGKEPMFSTRSSALEAFEASPAPEDDGRPVHDQPVLPENNRFLLQSQKTRGAEDAISPPPVLEGLWLASPTRRTESPRLPLGRFPITSSVAPRLSRGKGPSQRTGACSAGDAAAEVASLASRIPLFPAFDGTTDDRQTGQKDISNPGPSVAGVSFGDRSSPSSARCFSRSSPVRGLGSSASPQPPSASYRPVPRRRGEEEHSEAATSGAATGDYGAASSPLRRPRSRSPLDENKDGGEEDAPSSLSPRRERARSVSGGVSVGEGFLDSVMPRSGTPPFKGPRTERSDSAVVPSTPPRLPDSFDLRGISSFSGVNEEDRLNLLESSGASGGGESTPLGSASRRPRESFEFALADETATPSPFSRSKQRSRSSLGSPVKASGVADRGGGEAEESADPVLGKRGRREEGEEEEELPSSSSPLERDLMLTESPFRRSPLSSKRQCTFSPVKLTPPREAPSFFRADLSPNKKRSVVESTPVWLLDECATSDCDSSQGQPGAVGASRGSPADLLFSSLLPSRCTDREGGGCVQPSGSNFVAAVVASVSGETADAKVALVSQAFQALVGLGLDTLLRLPLARDLERLWSLFRSLRVICDREHHAGKPLALYSNLLPALNRLTRTGSQAAASSSILSAQPSERFGSPVSLGDSVVLPAAGILKEGQDPQRRSRQLDIEDLGRMLWVAPHLFGWRYRRLSAMAVGAPRSTPLTSPVSRRLRPGGGEDERGGQGSSMASPRKGLLLMSNESDEVDLELLEFSLPTSGSLSAVFLRASGESAPPEVIMVGREPHPGARLTHFRALLVFWTFLWQWSTLRQTRQASLQAPFLQACWHSLVSKGQWAAGFDPQTTPLPPSRSPPPLPAKPVIRSPGKSSSSGSPLCSSKAPVCSSATVSPVRSPLSARSSPFSSSASRAISASSSSSLLRRIEASLASPPFLSSLGLRNTLRSSAAVGSNSSSSRSASRATPSEGTPPATPDVFRCRLSSGDRSLSLSSVSVSENLGGAQTGVGASEVGADHLPRESAGSEVADASSQAAGSSRRSASASLSPISEKLRRKTEERRRARLQQEERRKQRAALHYEERRWANVAWVLGLLLDACVYRDRRSKIDLKTFMTQFVLNSKIRLSTHVVEECLQALANLSPAAVAFDGAVVTLTSSANPETLRQLVDGQAQEAREAIEAFAEESREPGSSKGEPVVV